MLLCGDIGGTKTSLALINESQITTPLALETYQNDHFSSFTEVLLTYRQKHAPKVSRVALAVAGPVYDEGAALTNRDWSFDKREIAQLSNVHYVDLFNDLEASSAALPLLDEQQLETLYEPEVTSKGHYVVISAGTGLGQGVLVTKQDQQIALATEAGHTDFTPRNDIEYALFKALSHEGYLAVETILSGKGIANLYDFLCDYHKEPQSYTVKSLCESMTKQEAITQLALSKKDNMCIQTLELFASIYGAEASNAALGYLSYSGIFLGGGIAPKILSFLKSEHFLNSFFNKGDFKRLLQRVPLYVVLDQALPIYGAAFLVLQ